MGCPPLLERGKYTQKGLHEKDGIIKILVTYINSFSTVVTNEHSNWSVIALEEKPTSLWVKAIRKADAVEIFYSLDNKNYKMSNVAYLPDNKPVMVGMMAASPDGEGF